MPYVKMTVIAGKTIEVYKRYTSRYKPIGAVRGKKLKETPEDVKKVNQRQAENKLRWKINSNFGEGDIYLTLTYRRENRKSPTEAKRELNLFIRRMRRLYKSKGEELRYIAVTEDHRTATHHHLVINGAVDAKEISRLWTWGFPDVKYLDDTGDYSKLAAYLIKETSETYKTAKSANRLRYTCSRNLKEPIIDREIVEYKTWRDDPRVIKGYYIAGEPERGIHELTGYPYMHYMMIRVAGRKIKKSDRAGTRTGRKTKIIHK